MNEKAESIQEQEEQPTSEETSSQAHPEPKTEGGFEEVDFSALTDSRDHEEPRTPEEPTDQSSADEGEPSQAEKDLATQEEEEEPVSAEQDETEIEDSEQDAQASAKEESDQPESPEADAPEQVKIPTREELRGMYDDFRKETLPVLEQMYQLSDEEGEAFDENPREALPKIAAKLHYESMMSSYNAMMAAMPGVVQNVMGAYQKAAAAEESFYNEWPELKDKKLEPVVQTAIRSYRQMNPKAPLQEVVQKAGALAMINAGLDPVRRKEQEAKPTTPSRKPPKPAAPGGANPTPPPKPKTTSSDEDIFAELTEAFDNSQFS